MLGFLGSLVSAGINAGAINATNKQNLALTRESWKRDDNAIQRATQDMLKAGINPLMAAGSPAHNSAPIAMKPPQVGDFGATLISEKATEAQTKLVANSIDVANGKLQNETNIANAQVVETLAKAHLTEEMITQARINTGIARDRHGYINEPRSEYDSLMKFIETLSPEFSQMIKDQIGAIGKRLAEGGSLTGPVQFSLFPKKEPTPPKPEKPKPLSEDEARARYYRNRLEGATRPEPEKDWGDADSYSTGK